MFKSNISLKVLGLVCSLIYCVALSPYTVNARVTVVNHTGQRTTGQLVDLSSRAIEIRSGTFKLEFYLKSLKTILFKKKIDSVKFVFPAIYTETETYKYSELLGRKSGKLRYRNPDGFIRKIAMNDVIAIVLANKSRDNWVWTYENSTGDTIRVTHTPDTTHNYKSDSLHWSVHRNEDVISAKFENSNSSFRLWEFPYRSGKSWQLKTGSHDLRMQWQSSHSKNWQGRSEHVLNFRVFNGRSMLLRGELAPNQGGPVYVVGRLNQGDTEAWKLMDPLQKKPNLIGVIPVFIKKYIPEDLLNH